jgi:hypothetical protein
VSLHRLKPPSRRWMAGAYSMQPKPGCRTGRAGRTGDGPRGPGAAQHRSYVALTYCVTRPPCGPHSMRGSPGSASTVLTPHTASGPVATRRRTSASSPGCPTVYVGSPSSSVIARCWPRARRSCPRSPAASRARRRHHLLCINARCYLRLHQHNLCLHRRCHDLLLQPSLPLPSKTHLAKPAVSVSSATCKTHRDHEWC